MFAGKYQTDANLIFFDGQTLPATTGAATSVTSDAIFINQDENTLMELVIVADTAITVATAKAFNIEIKTCATSGGSYTGPIAESHFYALHKTSADGELSISKGADIFHIGLTPDYFNKYMKIVLTSDVDLSAYKLSAFLIPASKTK